ncbi:MAG: DUF2062 domain-containing protein [Akkermansiaceae bacterium]|nr:DUF2062 domain-containing protein [Akkermansiaceae bacterium]MBJ7284925.1 DUF2062 domain-containing protein [Akkermansiaceae bacterium]
MSEMFKGVSTTKETWWRRWLVRPVVGQLTCGVSPQKIAWTISLGIVLGVFPVMGTTTLVCFLMGWMLRLNQPVLHVFKTLVYPLHLAMILVFIRMGEHLYQVPLISFSIPQLLERFKVDPLQFVRDFGMTAWYGVSAWLIVAPLAAFLIKLSVMPFLTKLAETIKRRQELTS